MKGGERGVVPKEAQQQRVSEREATRPGRESQDKQVASDNNNYNAERGARTSRAASWQQGHGSVQIDGLSGACPVGKFCLFNWRASGASRAPSGC